MENLVTISDEKYNATSKIFNLSFDNVCVLIESDKKHCCRRTSVV